MTVLDAAAVAAAFGLGEDARIDGPVARGELGQVWRLTTADGTWAVKQPFSLPARDEVEADARYQEVVAAAGVPMPSVVRTIAGDVVAMIGSVGVRVYSWVELEAPRRDLDPCVVGATVAAIHRIEHRGASGAHPWYSEPVGAEGWDALVADARHAAAPFADSLAAARDELVALEHLLGAPARLRTCHRDLFADNVLATASSDVCVIDWENSGLADQRHELAMVLFEFALGDATRARALHGAYVDAGGPVRVESPRDFTMIIAVQGHLLELAVRRWLDPVHAEERARNAARAQECLGDLLTRDLVALLLDAVRP